MWKTPITPRVSETDGAGHINNNFVPIWFEAGRREVFRILTPDLDFAKWRVALVNMNVDYLAQTYFHEEAEVRNWVDRLGTKSFTLYEELWQGERLRARGMVTYVYFIHEMQTSAPMPDGARDALAAHLRAEGATA
ncbi:MAG: thioesterase family protein [Rhodospirillaceae bacterium]